MSALIDYAPSTRAVHLPSTPRAVVRLPAVHPALGTGKRCVDVVGSLLALIMLAPVFLAVALIIRIDSRGPVLFRQVRIGVEGEPFTILKFRSMTCDAEEQLDALRGRNQGSGPLFKLRVDPRVTRVGRVLRKLSLDELPQLLNVLRGDMSLVGPRPALADEVAEYDARALRRLAVRPGITGAWQVGGRSDLEWEEGLSLDLGYVTRWSHAEDMRILARTVAVVVQPRGAY